MSVWDAHMSRVCTWEADMTVHDAAEKKGGQWGVLVALVGERGQKLDWALSQAAAKAEYSKGYFP